MRKLTDEVRALGFKWGSYTESGTAGCNGAKGSSEGFEEQDAALFFDDFKSEYLMVDGCGIEVQAPPHGPPKDWPVCPGCSPRAAQSRWEMTKWRTMIDETVAQNPAFFSDGIMLHDCHNGCGSEFGGTKHRMYFNRKHVEIPLLSCDFNRKRRRRPFVWLDRTNACASALQRHVLRATRGSAQAAAGPRRGNLTISIAGLNTCCHFLLRGESDHGSCKH
jgi:hypothetical protein